MKAQEEALVLGFSLCFEDLYDDRRLARVDEAFCTRLAASDPRLAQRLAESRRLPPADPALEAALLLELAPHLDGFIAQLFAIEGPLAALLDRQAELSPLYEVKRNFVQRRAQRALRPEEAQTLDPRPLQAKLDRLLGTGWSELDFARAVLGWLADETTHEEALQTAARYAAWALSSEEGRHRHKAGILFKAPAKYDPLNRVAHEESVQDGVTCLTAAPDHKRRRDGFALTDPGTDLAGGLDQIRYCIFCHHQGKDSCSKGMRDKKSGAFQRNAVGVEQTGCPLEERISEMHEAKDKGQAIAALALAAIDNPMIAGTGHRICNDCMTGCIYTNGNKDPVDIPQAETRILKDVLALPWGFEIYGLLTRWNPLNLRRPLPRPASGRSVLVAGLGPAGYTLAHHLLNDGHAVVAIDGLKIEPLPEALSGVAPDGTRRPFLPIKEASGLWEALDSRVMAGFGGVAEYGITVRWDKNFLKIIRLLLERRQAFTMIGGVRLGGTVHLDEALAMGFDHVALCMGAGKPTVIPMPGNLARGVRQASDFLMALQLTGAARRESLANLQLRLPVVVIGGGLTAIDACTEALAYYPVQVEKYLARFEILAAGKDEAAVLAGFSEEEAGIAREFLDHARAIRAERRAAAAEARPPRILELLQGWGGATIAYRRQLTDSPAYRNHEEVNKAFEEGIRFAPGLTPLAVLTDSFGHAAALKVRTAEGAERQLPARSVIVAAGTVPNTVLAREEEGIALDGKYFQAQDADGNKVRPQSSSKPSRPDILIDRDVSFFGDLHPSYAGNVVSAMASAKQGYPLISAALAAKTAPPPRPPAELATLCNQSWRARVERVERLTPTIVEVVVKAPAAARAFKPGQFYRLQNFETLAPRADGAILAMEGLALTGAWVDPEEGLVSVIVLEMGGSSDLCALLKPGEPVVLMGPTGAPTETLGGGSALLAGGGLGNAVLFSIGRALRQAGSRVLYFAGYRTAADLFKQEEIEEAADMVVWCVDQGPPIEPRRPDDRAFIGNIVEAMAHYGSGGIAPSILSLAEIDHILAIGSDRMMQAVAAARHGRLAPYLKRPHTALGSINSPMQCMMKEICAQCLQRHVDPVSGEECVVFTCANQDQPLDLVDFNGLHERLLQNAVAEKITRQWIDRSLTALGLRRKC